MSEDTMTSDETTRRDFLFIASGMMGVVGVAGLAWPFIDQMRPDAAVRAAGQPVEIDVSTVEPGAAIIVTWRGKPYFVRRLTEEEIGAVSAVANNEMKDPAPYAERIGGPTDEATKDWVVVAANCTHLGCIPKVVDSGADGWHCPCHGSVFDFTGRILRGPAPINLPQPPHVFASDTSLIIGTDTV